MTPVWVELRDVKTCLMDFALEMLQRVGPVLYAAKNVETGKSNIIKGCVMADLSKDLKDVIKMVVPEPPDKIMKQAITYTKLPDACFICRERGYFARSCPTTQSQNEEQAFARSTRQAPAGPGVTRGRGPTPVVAQHQRRRPATRGRNQGAVDNEGFRRVRSRSRRRFQEPDKQVNMVINNRFGVLQDEEEVNNETPNKSQSKPVATPPQIPIEKADSNERSAPEQNSEGRKKPKVIIKEATPSLSARAGGGIWHKQPKLLMLTTNEKLDILSWNVCGVADPTRTILIKQKIKDYHVEVEIFGMQELKAKQFEAELFFKKIARGGTFVADYAANSWCYSALICKPEVTILDRGVKGDGFGSWVKVPAKRGTIGILNLYVPHDTEKRRQVWEWTRQLTATGHWIILGDHNIVEFAEDTNGSTPLIHGAEERQWKRLCQERDIIDVFLTATQREGPWFTCFRVKENDVELSRLDRVYLTDSGEWIDNIAKITHHSRSSVSDHYPVKVHLQLEETPEDRRAWHTYFKASVEDLQSEEVRQQIESAWKDHPASTQDPRIRWDLAWARVLRILKDHSKKKKQLTPNREELLQELEKWRSKLLEDNSRENRMGFILTCDMLKELECAEAKKWRQRSRGKWIKDGDAPTRYFFSLWKAKKLGGRLLKAYNWKMGVPQTTRPR
ncbi:hypothetical protein R1sor_013586 [Riccia sorocarpa]|uniref:Uncharacterized protein n=1 Tax=Riccia sorocarpa TaxID=122646 RepID=A0ABD3H9L9_9MARC